MKENHIFPFLWVRDEPDEKIYREIDAIRGLTDAFIIESRPKRGEKSDFGTINWFTRIGKILAYAQKLNMTVWVLDDKSFPTGYAGGAVIDKYPHLKAKQIKANAVDFYSDGSLCFIPTGAMSGEKVIASFLTAKNRIIKELEVKGDFALIKGVKGDFRAVMLVETTLAYEREGYIDMLNGESTEILVKEIYERYYSHCKEYFGNTLKGFFSDEPRFSNGYNSFYSPVKSMYENKVGLLCGAYPYSDEVFNVLLKKGYDKSDILSLFCDFKGYEKLRVDYMNIITDLYTRNFTEKLSAWCKARGICYAGHVIEDGGVHFNLGCGAGHYFKAMRGADYAGVDVVLHQIKPFVKRNAVAPIECGIADYDFNNFTLARLGGSCAVQSDTAQGKSVCEIFGAYGFGESVKTMFYLVNHFVVNGINNFIPHAFSMDLSDNDCPPYFYGEGKTPAYDGYKILFAYMQRMCSFSDGKCYAKVAVFYNAESVWSGKKYLSINKTARVLTENQIEFDFIDADNLKKAKKTQDRIIIGNAEYSLLVVNNGYYSQDTACILNTLQVPIIYVNGSKDLNELPKKVLQKVSLPYKFSRRNKNLRVRKLNGDTLMLFNAGGKRIINSVVFGSKNYVYDLIRDETVNESAGGITEFTLNAGEAVLLTSKKIGKDTKAGEKVREIKKYDLYCKQFDGNDFREVIGRKTSDGFFTDNPDFSGFLRYEFSEEFFKGEYLRVCWRGEFLRAETGGKIFDFISSPSDIPVPQDGKKVILTVCNTLANAKKDFLSRYDKVTVCGVDKIEVYAEG